MSGRVRARGFAAWSPRAGACELLELVGAVLDEYRDHLPLTIRQIFYRLVGTRGYAKSEAAYKALGEVLNWARRAGLFPFSVIRDDGITANPAPGWESVDSLIKTFRRAADAFTLDRQQGQRQRLIVICEAAGMVPQIERVAHPYSVEVLSSGGFDSTTAKHALACKVVEAAGDSGLAVEILHIGDHDPSGVHIFQSLAGDVRAFAADLGGAVEFTRLALTAEQAERLGLPTAPAKTSDRRSFAGINGDATATVQAEAIPPDELARIVQAAIDARIDHDAYAAGLEAEKHAKASLAAWLASRR